MKMNYDWQLLCLYPQLFDLLMLTPLVLLGFWTKSWMLLKLPNSPNIHNLYFQEFKWNWGLLFIRVIKSSFVSSTFYNICLEMMLVKTIVFLFKVSKKQVKLFWNLNFPHELANTNAFIIRCPVFVTKVWLKLHYGDFTIEILFLS